jgi:sulfoxide reductase catalytic subunit YedY
VLGKNGRVATQLYNGYADQVAHLYADLKGEALFM